MNSRGNITGRLYWGLEQVNHSREQREKEPLTFTLNMAIGTHKKQVNVAMGCDLIFVDGPFGMIADAEWDVYSASFYSYMGGLCLTTMDRAGMVILFVPESSVRTEMTVAGQTIHIFRQQAIIDAFCASSNGWPLQWYCHPQVQYWHRGACQIGNNASGPQPVLQPYVVLHLVTDPKENAKNKLKRWSPLRCTVGKGVTGYTNCMVRMNFCTNNIVKGYNRIRL